MEAREGDEEEFTIMELNPSKTGSSSPWAVFDAWGAGGSMHQVNKPTAEEMHMLEPEAVRVPWEGEEGEEEGQQQGQGQGQGQGRGGSKPIPSETDILNAYDKLLASRSTQHLGYPYNLMFNHEELYSFMKYSINNLGDPFVASNYGVHSRQFEVAVIDFFAKLFKIPKGEYWGYVTTCGTEGNLHGLLLARECQPDGILYYSRESHYSVPKAAKYYRMDEQSIPTLPTGEINYEDLATAISKNIHRPVIINVNVGTTVKGAVDNLDRILRILSKLNIPRERFHIHCDGALFAMMLPFVQFAPELSFEKPIDSIAVSGHKMLGCPMPCGIALTRMEHVKKVEQHIAYLNSVDTTIMGSRNGQASLYLWYSLRKKGVDGIRKDVELCLSNAQYLWNQLRKHGIRSRLNDLSCTVVMERPMSDSFVKRWQLACEEDIAHVVVMPNVTKEKIDIFVSEYAAVVSAEGRMESKRPNSPLAVLEAHQW